MSATDYVKDESGACYIPASQRPDGTWRKARRVKEGYVPQDEVPLYESKGKQWAKSKPDHPVGLAPDDVEALRTRRENAESGIPGLASTESKQGLSKSQKKKAAAAKKKAAALEMELNHKLENTHISGDKKPQEPVQGVPATDPSKRLRNLKKKLRDIEKLERQIASGELKNPEPEQLEKIKKKAQVEDEIADLEENLESNDE
ncbi:partner of Y14 and mago isoform X3 [Oratosquilla oratoria]|uniref:partner of Y14 and mago isoform X3 n=1 Tax=Oratosquilla oratoria TaxID=337810 RepID=UPI003F771AB0